MVGISHCLLVGSGIVVILEPGEKDNILESPFELKTGQDGLSFQGAGITIPFTAQIVEHLLETEEGLIFIYDGDDNFALKHVATIPVEKGLRLRAQGALWVLANQASGAGTSPEKPEETADDSLKTLYPGLKIPPEMKKGPGEAKEPAAATA